MTALDGIDPRHVDVAIESANAGGMAATRIVHGWYDTGGGAQGSPHQPTS
jgi:hypothetical protein